jgi:SPP1 family phage portal protein
MSDKISIDTSRLQDLINDNLASKLKRDMADSVRYYNCEHDILTSKRQYFRDGILVDNKSKSNNVIPHPFHTNLVNQKADYIARNPITINIAGEANGEAEAVAFRTVLINEMTEKFDDVVYDWVLGASKKSFEAVHFYINPDGELRFCIVPAEQIIPIYDTQYQDKLVYIIRFYGVDYIAQDGGKKKLYKVEWWSKDNVEYFEQIEDGSFIHDGNYTVNPYPHWVTDFVLDGQKTVTESHSWGRVPFVLLWNNSNLTNDLKPIKALIDVYDKIKGGWANDIEDFQEILYVIKGLSNLSQEMSNGLTELGMLIKNIKEDGAIAVEEDGDVKTLRAEIPVVAKESFLALTTAEIFYFGEGISLSEKTLGVSHAPSGVALKFLYAPLDMKSDRLILKLKSALKEFVWFVTNYINTRDGLEFDSNKITFTVNKSMIFSESEKIQSLVASKDMLSEETILANHPFVDDVQGEMELLKRQRDAQTVVDQKNLDNQMAMVGLKKDNNAVI